MTADGLPPPAAVLFDLDGLLLDTEPLHARAWASAAAHFGRRLSPEELGSLRGRRRQDCALQVQHWIDAEGGAAVAIDDLLAIRQPLAEALMATAPAIPGAAELVRQCHASGLPMALVTSSTAEAVALKAAPHPWLELITERVHGDDPELEDGKPAPDGFLLAARRLAVAPSRCWALEDSVAGARAARAAGCHVLVLWSAQEPGDRLPDGVHTIASLDEVLDRVLDLVR